VRTLAAPLACLLALGLTAACGGDVGDGDGGGATALEDVPWILASGLDAEGWEALAPSAMFAGGTVGGSTGCNRFTAPYTVDGDALELGTVASTRMACPPPADAVEREYLAALGRVTGWRSEDEELVLVDEADAELLRYRRATPVGDWEVTAFLSGNAVSSPLLGTQITATFREDGTLTGSAGCNAYNATFTTDRGKIEISMPAATRKHCAMPEGVMEQEAAYLAALPAAVRYRVDGGSLALLTADGTYVVSYARAGKP
jgi:heat shock protein HslJ